MMTPIGHTWDWGSHPIVPARTPMHDVSLARHAHSNLRDTDWRNAYVTRACPFLRRFDLPMSW